VGALGNAPLARMRTFCGAGYYCTWPKISPLIGDFRLLFYQGTLSGSGVTPISAVRIMDSNGDIIWGLDGPLVKGEPTWSPDAQYVAFAGQTGQADRVIQIARIANFEMHWLAQTAGSDATFPAWTR